MVKKYVKALENRELNSRTGEVWSIYDVPSAWSQEVERQIIKDGYRILEDGTVVPKEDEVFVSGSAE